MFLSRRNRSEEHTSELQSQSKLVCRLLLEKKNTATLNQLHRRTIMKRNVHQLVRTQPDAIAQATTPPAPTSAETTKPPRPPDALLTMDEISIYLGVSKRTLKKWVTNGTIPHRRLGKKWGRVRFSKDEVDQWSKPK